VVVVDRNVSVTDDAQEQLGGIRAAERFKETDVMRPPRKTAGRTTVVPGAAIATGYYFSV